MKMRHLVALIVLVCATLLSSHPALAQFSQQGPKLVGTGAVGIAGQGVSVSVSADGNTAIVGGPGDDGGAYDGGVFRFGAGAAWVWTRSGGVWTQQGAKLVGSGAVGNAGQGYSASLSADGNTAIVGGYSDNGSAGAAWVWTRSGAVWIQQGTKLVGSGAVGTAYQGYSVSLSADGNTAVVGAPKHNSNAGAAWVWTRSAGVWTQQGTKLVGSGAVGAANQGLSVSLSADGNTAIVGGDYDNSQAGAVWVWTRSAGVWTQQGSKLVGSGAVGIADQGWSVSLSADGNTAIVGGNSDNGYAGAAWVWTRSAGVWTQQGSKLVGSGAVGVASQGASVSLSADGNTAIVGGDNDNDTSNGNPGAAWVWTRSAGVWTQQGSKLVGSGAVGAADQSCSVSLSADGNTAIVGGPADNSLAGAAWVFTASAPAGSWVLPSSAFRGGVNGAEFHTDVRILNLGTSPVTVTATFYDQASGTTFLAPAFPVAARSQASFDNVLQSLFGKALASGSYGPIRFDSTGPIIVSSSVNNVNACGTGATSGQWLPGIDATKAMTAGLIAQLAVSTSASAGYRTNLVVMNPGSANATATVKLRAGGGVLLSSGTIGPLEANGFSQVPLDSAGTFPGVAGRTDTNLWVEFTSDQPVLAFASVINNASGDPFAVVATPDAGGGASGSWVLPSSAFRGGLNGAEFHTDVRILNLGTSPVTVIATLYDQASGTTVPAPGFPVAGRSQASFDNVLQSLFGKTLASGSYGPIRFDSTGSIIVSSSVNNVNACGTGATSGQWLPGIDATKAMTAGLIPQLAVSASTSAGYRTNLVVMNPGSANATATVKLRAGGGVLLSSGTIGPLEANGFSQVPLDSAGTFPGVAGRTDTNLWVEFTSDQPVLAFASVINNASGDPFAVVATPDATAIPVSHSLSGAVSGDTLSGVTITVTGTATASATTDSSGNYSVTGVYDGSYTMTPSKTGYTFTPFSLAVTVSGVALTGKNFIAKSNAASTYSISGAVSGAVQSGVTVTLGGVGSATTYSNGSGNYTFAGLVNGSYTITPSMTGYTFSPANATANVSGGNTVGKDFVATAIPATYSQADLTGTWHATVLRAGSINGWMRATVTLDSSGLATVSSFLDSTGNSTPPAAGSSQWTISGSGVISETGVNAASLVHMTMTSNKNFIAGTGSDGTSQLRIIQKVVPGTVYTNADVQNKSFVYHSLWSGSTNGGSPGWIYGAGTTDTAGNTTISSQTTSWGSSNSAINELRGTFVVDGNGNVTLIGNSFIHGFMSDDKKTIVVTDTSESFGIYIIQITGQTYTAGLLPAGISAAHMLAIGNTAPAPFWLHFTSTVASGGVITLSDWVSSNSGITNPGTTNHGSFTASGTVTITEKPTYHGQMSDDGKFTVATQTNASGVYSLQVNTK